MEINLESFSQLEKSGVYIDYSADHYKDGSNLCFSINFSDNGKRVGTGWYNDNHEFGDAHSTIIASIKLANWYLEKPERISLINSGYHNKEYIEYNKELSDFTQSLTK